MHRTVSCRRFLRPASSGTRVDAVPRSQRIGRQPCNDRTDSLDRGGLQLEATAAWLGEFIARCVGRKVVSDQ